MTSSVTTADEVALRAVGVQFWVNGAVVASYVPRLPGIRDNLDVDLSTIGTILAVATAFGLLGSVGVGPATERFGSKRVMIGGALVLVAMLPLVSLVTSVVALLLVLAILSVGDVFTDVAMNMQGSALSGRRQRPVMNRLHAMWSLGTVVGGLVAAAMAALDVDLRLHLAGASVVLAITLLYVAPGLLRNDEPPDGRPATTKNGMKARSVVLTFFVLGAAAIVPEMINSDWAAFRLTDDLDASKGLAGLAYVAFTSGMVTGRFAGDWAVERLGAVSVLRRATALAAGGIALATLVPNIAVTFIGLYLTGVGVSVMFPQLYDAAARAERPGKALGGLTAGSRFALLVAPLLVGMMADTQTLSVGQAIALSTLPAAALVLYLTTRLNMGSVSRG